MKPTPEALKLFTDGQIALAQVEANGIRVDTEYLDTTIEQVSNRIKRLQTKLREDKVFQLWRKEFGDRTNLGSRSQLAKIIFERMGYKSTAKTATGRNKTDEDELEKIDLPFVRRYVKVEKLKKLKSTFLDGLRREVVNGLVHPMFNLNTVSSYRSSADNPNIQNQPNRDPKAGEMIRRAYIPRKGHKLVEVDFGALEFRVAACFWKDRRMIEYASDPSLDIHRDIAMELFRLPSVDVTKQLRYLGKNGFVFPVLYGSYYMQCTRNIWNDSVGLKTGAGVGIYEHLQSKGIMELGECDPKNYNPKPGTFEAHVQKVEKRFYQRFPDFSKGKEQWEAKYRQLGGFHTLTGFWLSGLFSRNELMNLPIQGSGFHCLLWALIRLLRTLKKRKMRSKVVAEIHDSILADVPDNEVQEYISLAKRIMTVDLPAAWKWIVVPLAVEVDVASTSWFDKKPWIEKEGVWMPK